MCNMITWVVMWSHGNSMYLLFVSFSAALLLCLGWASFHTPYVSLAYHISSELLCYTHHTPSGGGGGFLNAFSAAESFCITITKISHIVWKVARIVQGFYICREAGRICGSLALCLFPSRHPFAKCVMCEVWRGRAVASGHCFWSVWGFALRSCAANYAYCMVGWHFLTR